MARYVGGRIVPTHGGVWDGSKTYEELTIVLREDTGDSYISKRPVPAGTAITEEHYWVIHSLFSEQVDQAVSNANTVASAIRGEMNSQRQEVYERMSQAEQTVEEKFAETERTVDSRARDAESLSNENRNILEERMSRIETRQEANVRASTDASADYAAEMVDARVDTANKTHESLGSHIRSIENEIADVVITDEIRTVIEATRNPTFYLHGTIGPGTIRTAGSGLIVYAIPVEAGKVYRVIASNVRTLDNSYAFLAFSENPLANEASCTILVNGSTTVANVDYTYPAEENGYLYLVRGAESTMSYAFYEVEYANHIITDKSLTQENMPADAGAVEKRFDLLGYTTESHKSSMILQEHEVSDRFITAAGILRVPGLEIYAVAWYPVKRGHSYLISGKAQVGGPGQGLICFDDVYDASESHQCKEVIELGQTTMTEYNLSFSPEKDGYIVMPKISSNYLVVLLVSDTDFQRIYDIEKAVNDIEAKLGKTKMSIKIQLFGDSITDNLWGDQSTWANYIQQNLADYEVVVVNDAVGGSGIGHGKSSGTTDSHQEDEHNFVHDLVTDGTTLQTDADYIIILVGTNNWASGTDLGDMTSEGPATVYGALKGIMEYIAEHSAATIFVCTIPQRYNSVDQGRQTNANGEPLNSDGVSLAEYCNAFRVVSEFYGMPCIDLNKALGWNRLNISNFCNDGLHPNTKGDKVLSAVICSEIMKHLGRVSR